MQFIKPTWPAPKNVCAFTTTRQQGNSIHPYSSFNLAPDVGDDPIHVANNRQLLISVLNLPAEPIWLSLEHGANVITIDSSINSGTHQADAAITQSPQIVCGITTADCLPILICDKRGETVAAIHAGWRGLAKGIIENTFQALQKHPDELLVWLGPAIGPNYFEVSSDVFEAFVAQDQEASACFTPKKNTEQKWLANIYLLARHRLNRLGVNAIYGGEFCTYTDEKNFYSFRRDHHITGRMATLIWLQA